jgi:predicted ATP-dependent serine protease
MIDVRYDLGVEECENCGCDILTRFGQCRDCGWVTIPFNIAIAEPDDIDEWASHLNAVSVDSMGLDTIYYWRSLTTEVTK